MTGHLSGKDEIGEEDDGSGRAHKVGDRLHDVPVVLPEHQVGEEPKLQRHPRQP